MEAVLSRATYPDGHGCDAIEIETPLFVGVAIDFGSSATGDTQAPFDTLLALFSQSFPSSEEEPLYKRAPMITRVHLELSEEELRRIVLLFGDKESIPERLVA